MRKQLKSYEGFDDEETKAVVQRLKLELSEAESDLESTEFDRLIDNTQKLTDDLYNKYSEILNSRLDNIDFLLEQVIDGINMASGADGTLTSALGVDGAIAQAIVNAVGENGSIKSILNTEATSVGTTLSNAMNNIWSVGDGNAKSILTTYGQGFQDKQTTTNVTLSSIKASIDRMVDDVDKDAKKKTTANKTSTSAKKNPTSSSSSSTNKKATTTTTTKKATSTGDGKAKVGDKVKFISGKYYYDSYGKKPLGSKYKNKQVYITKINKKGSYPYHISTGNKLGKGDLGWVKLKQISGYSSGKQNFLNDEIAWTQEGKKQEFIVRPSDGAILTPVAKRDSILNANASRNIWDMANSPAEFIKENLGLGNTNIPNGTNVNNNVTQHFSNTLNFPNVKNYEEMLIALSKDPKFDKLINAMTADRYMGKSSLAKGKAIR